MLRVENVWHRYDAAPVLRGVNLELPSGAFLGVLGPNGSGKTTLLRLLAGLSAPWQGRVTLEGLDLARMPRRELAQRIAVVPQETQLAFDYSVLEIALMGRYPHLGAFELESPDDLSIARDALAATGTAELEGRAFATLSGGEKQRVVIASALAQLGSAPGRSGVGPVERPRLLLLDEPTASLDLRYQLEIADLLRSLAERPGLTIVLSTHDLDLAAALCRDLVLLRDGSVAAMGPTRAVLTPAAIRDVYGVEAEIVAAGETGGLRVTPLRRTPEKRWAPAGAASQGDPHA